MLGLQSSHLCDPFTLKVVLLRLLNLLDLDLKVLDREFHLLTESLVLLVLLLEYIVLALLDHQLLVLLPVVLHECLHLLLQLSDDVIGNLILSKFVGVVNLLLFLSLE